MTSEVSALVFLALVEVSDPPITHLVVMTVTTVTGLTLFLLLLDSMPPTAPPMMAPTASTEQAANKIHKFLLLGPPLTGLSTFVSSLVGFCGVFEYVRCSPSTTATSGASYTSNYRNRCV